MQLIVLRPDGQCIRLPFWLLGGLLLLLAALLAGTSVGAYWVGQEHQRALFASPASVPNHALLEEAERQAAREGLAGLAERVVTLERQLARADLRMQTVGETLEIDFADLEPFAGGQGGPELLGPDTPPEMDDRLVALERLLATHRERVALLGSALREGHMREALRPRLRPVEDDAWVSSRFGYRDDPFTGQRRFHAGIDYAGRPGSDILASGDGIVVFAGRRGAYGNMVELDHGGGLRTRYAHNSELLVERGDRVEAGQAIGRMGRTGRATGTHLHYEVRQDGDAIDPVPFITTANRAAAD